MQHSFDISIAEKYGIEVAIFLNNIAFWIKKNQANDKHFHNGRYWTYNSSKALSELFPYWSSDQMDRLIKKCVKLDLLLIDNFNETTYDRTRWYGLTDIGLDLFNMSIPRFRGMDSAKSPHPFREIAEPIPDINTDIKQDIYCASNDARTQIPVDKKNSDKKLINETFEKFWKIYPRKQGKKKASSIWERQKLHLKSDAIIQSLQKQLNDFDWQDIKFVPHASTYLNGERWMDESSANKKSVNQEQRSIQEHQERKQAEIDHAKYRDPNVVKRNQDNMEKIKNILRNMRT